MGTELILETAPHAVAIYNLCHNYKLYEIVENGPTRLPYTLIAGHHHVCAAATAGRA